MPEHRSHLSKSGFDVSQSLAFTSSVGMILPIYSDFLNSGEKVSVRSNLFARTQPLVTPAMADVDIYLDWFFVPMTMLYTAFGQIRYQTRDFISSFYENSVNSGVPGRPNGGFPILDASSLTAPRLPSGSFSFNQVPVFSINPGDVAGIPLTYSSGSFESSGKSMFRMLDLFGFNPRGVFANGTIEETSNPNVFPYKALAYQAIYQHYFRNDDYERFDVSTYNWDRYFSSSTSVALSTVGNSSSVYINPRNPFILRYCDYRKDYFQSVKPSPILSGMNLLEQNVQGSSGVLNSINNYLASGVSIVQDVSPNPTAGTLGGYDFSSQVNLSVSDSGAKQTVANLRSLFAVEKLMRITGRSAKDYDSQVLAHFGFKIPHDVKHELTHLTSLQAQLSTAEVVSTADTYSSGSGSGSALGELAGKGYVSIRQKKPLRWTAPVDGVLMCTFRAVPRMRTTQIFDRQNAVTQRTDLFIPEFDKLGMQPLYRYEVDPAYIGQSTQIGWQIRYQQYKRKYDRATYVFGSGANLNGINQYSSWILSYDPLSGVTSMSDRQNGTWLKVRPTDLNQIMAVPYQPNVEESTFPDNPASEFYTDPFICDFRADVKKVSVMSPTGEPDLISL